MKSLKNKTALVTGGAGFIGSHLSQGLLDMGARVIVLDDLSTGKKENMKDFLKNPKLFFIRGDANNLNTLKNIFASYKIDYVFHYAAKVGVVRTYEDPLGVLRDLEGFRPILELSKKNKIKKAIFSSSSEVYGNPLELPSKEDGALNPKIPYAAAKLVGEHYFRFYFHKLGLPATALRFFNVYGPRQESSSYGFVTGIFIRQALEGKPLTVYGNGTQTRDFVFIKDNVRAAIATLFAPKTDGEVINLGSGKPSTILNLAKKIAKVSEDPKVKIKFVPRPEHDFILYRHPHVSKMKQLLGFLPEYSLEDGLRMTYDWYKQNYGKRN
ncbi:NAD-dependent epimerase/dehydratase family protein [Candidatus Giovannonibacteria bacterium]|nr:NAD-dependent epimerase/dehydratase family protein [Candidatus Giovannonibacteria bacterium]